jgi:hypothetical protein
MRSDDLPPADRFGWWCEQVSKDTVPSVVSSPHNDDFHAVVTLAELGPAQLTIHTFPEFRAVRPPALIGRSDPELYGLSLMVANALWLSQRDHDSTMDAGDLLLYDTSQPYDSWALPGTGLGRVLMLHFPKTALPLRPERLNSQLAQRMPAVAGMSAIFARYLTSLASAVERGEVSEPETQRLGEVAIDLAAATLAAQLDAEDRLTPETRTQALLSRIEAFIEHNLGDPDLTPPGSPPTTTFPSGTCTGSSSRVN